MKKIFLTIIAVAATLVACNKAEVAPVNANDDARIVKFNVTNNYAFETKTAIAASSHVAIYAGEPINFANQDYTVGSMPTAEPAAAGTLSGSSIKWGVEQVGTETNTKFFAMYPYEDDAARDEFDATHTLSYTIDATTASEEYAKDFLVDVVDQNPGTDVEHPNAVTFNLEHPFALLRYAITNTSDDAIQKVEIYGVHKSGTLAYSTAAITATGDAIASGSPRNMPQESVVDNVYTYYSVIVPENSINPTIKITTWGGESCTYALSAAQNFVAGKTYTASITYGGTTHAATTSVRDLTVGFNVTDWSAAVNPTVGDKANATDNTDNWPFVRGTNFGSDWDTGLAMKCMGENTYRLVITATAAGEFKIYKKTGNTWLGKSGDPSTDDEWSYWAAVDADNVPIDAAGTYTIYYYSDGPSGAQIWLKSGNETR